MRLLRVWVDDSGLRFGSLERFVFGGEWALV